MFGKYWFRNVVSIIHWEKQRLEINICETKNFWFNLFCIFVSSLNEFNYLIHFSKHDNCEYRGNWIITEHLVTKKGENLVV